MKAIAENETSGNADEDFELLDKANELPRIEIVYISSKAMTRFCFLAVSTPTSSILSLDAIVPSNISAMLDSLNIITPASTKVKTINVPRDIRFARASSGTKQAIKAATKPVIKIPSDIV
jgi:hypothetical protein